MQFHLNDKQFFNSQPQFEQIKLNMGTTMYSNFFAYAVIFLYVINLYFCSDLYSDKVLNYDEKTFNKKIGGTPHFVNFFAPW